MKNVTFVAAALSVLLASCSSVSEPKKIKYYTYEESVDLCFAWSKNGYGDIATNVPCTDLVLAKAGVRIRRAAAEVRDDGLRP